MLQVSKFLGWDRTIRERNLQHLTNSTRFLIPSGIQIPHLASHVPGIIVRRIRAVVKDVYLYSLTADFWRELCALPPSELDRSLKDYERIVQVGYARSPVAEPAPGPKRRVGVNKAKPQSA